MNRSSSQEMGKERAMRESSEQASFAEVALRLGGKTEDEARRTGAVDSADDQVESLFSAPYQTAQSPVHRAIWDRHVPTELFVAAPHQASEDVEAVINRSLAVVRRHLNDKTFLGSDAKINENVMEDLAEVGYWGLLVDPAYGGSGASMRQFSQMITKMATLDPTIAGLASVHGCIGAVDPLRSFGTEEQKAAFLPKLASGERLSAFALTEPGAGSDLTALRTTAELHGDHYRVTGEKLFITNARPGRTIGLVCKIDGKPAVLVADLPEQTSESFRMKRYGLHALRRAHNNGLVFHDFPVPKENLLRPSVGDGLTIAYHGLNLGRVALCANAAGVMRWMLAEMLPWAGYRMTYGQAIEGRELVQRRIGRLAGMMVACDALSDWCSGLLDQGYRGEMECIIAKVFGSEMQKTAAIELFMKTHGGRSFLHGHPFGDNVHEFLAPCIYEGEGEMLSMAFFKSLVKQHGKQYFEPIGRILHEKGIRQPNLMNPSHLLALQGPMRRYATWYLGRRLTGASWSMLDSSMMVGPQDIRDRRVHQQLTAHVRFAQRFLSRAAMQISGVMRTHQLNLADRQCRMSALSADLQDAVVVMVTALHGLRSSDVITRGAADVMCRELRLRITGGKPSDADFRKVTRVGRQIVETQWSELAGLVPGNIMMPYSNPSDANPGRHHAMVESER